MFIALIYRVIPLRKERNVSEHAKAHCAPLERRGYLRMRGYKRCAPPEHFIPSRQITFRARRSMEGLLQLIDQDLSLRRKLTFGSKPQIFLILDYGINRQARSDKNVSREQMSFRDIGL